MGALGSIKLLTHIAEVVRACVNSLSLLENWCFHVKFIVGHLVLRLFLLMFLGLVPVVGCW